MDIKPTLETKPTIYVVDDMESNRVLLEDLMESVDLPVKSYESAKTFLKHEQPSHNGCLLLDIRMPEMSGLDLQKELNARGIKIPVIMVTAHADVPVAIQALKEGAFDLIQKPFNNQAVLDQVYKALEQGERQGKHAQAAAEVLACYRALTPRERDVMNEVVQGEPNKRIAYNLDISERTVEIHRSRMMEKMQAASLADLVRMAVVIEANEDQD